MNIFVLDYDPRRCAIYHCDKHVVKMILETAQMMCTVLSLQGISAPYKKTHERHPCTLWLQESMENWLWLEQMVTHLNEEYKYRYDHTKSHSSFEIIEKLKKPILPDIPKTKFVQAMPEKYKNKKSAVKAYRAFYLQEKRHFCSWTKRPIPAWFV